MSMSDDNCPQGFCGFGFDDLKEWLVEHPDYIAITHNPDVLFLQFSGWSVNLYRDGSYTVEVTEGG